MSLEIKELTSQDVHRTRFFRAATVVVICFLLLALRVWYLQILKGSHFALISEQNRITVKSIPAMRGKIFDRSEKVIADSRASFDVTVTPSRIRGELEEVLAELFTWMDWNEEELPAIFEKLKRAHRHDATVIKRDLPQKEVARFLARNYQFPGIEVLDFPARSYPYQSHGSHLLGYIGEINRSRLEKLRNQGVTEYQLGDIVGIAGVEYTFEDLLRGRNGTKPFVEDAWGRELGEEYSRDLLPDFRAREPVAGDDLVLSIDLVVQEAAEEAFEGASGAVVAMDPRNGDVLALISRPEYLPSNFVRGVSSKYWKSLTKDPLNPLYDRALRGQYPPGSTFKIISGLAALQEGVATTNETIFCTGSYRVGREVKRCWKRVGHGPVDYHKALRESCDVWFYEMGKRMGVDAIAQAARNFHLGEPTGIGINREAPGLIPTEAWKKKTYGEPWVTGETLSVVIGQGAVSSTPIQMATAFSALINGGRVLRPRIALRAQRPSGETTKKFDTYEHGTLPYSEEHIAATIEGLRAVVEEEGGTAYWTARSKLVRIGGKTGTSQVVGRRSEKKLEDHAWFVGFAPIENPTIVVAVIVEHGGHGSSAAAPIAKKVIEAYLGETG